MLDLILFFWNSLRAFFGRPFVADPNSWLTRSNQAFSERWEQPMAQSVCTYFWRAVYLEPLTRGPRFMPGEVSRNSLMLIAVMAIGLTSSYFMWMPRYEMSFINATLSGLALGVAVFVFVNALLRFRVALILIPIAIVVAVFLLVTDWKVLAVSYAVVFGTLIVGGGIFYVGTRFFCPRISYPEHEEL